MVAPLRHESRLSELIAYYSDHYRPNITRMCYKNVYQREIRVYECYCLIKESRKANI